MTLVRAKLNRDRTHDSFNTVVRTVCIGQYVQGAYGDRLSAKLPSGLEIQRAGDNVLKNNE